MSESSGGEVEEMSEQSDDVSGVWSEPEEPADETKPQVDAKVGKRIAVTNLDWDTINATDLFVLFSSFVRSQNKGGSIVKVQIYPSLFGIEQMKKDKVEGPPKAMFSAKHKKRAKASNPHSIKVNDPEFISDDEYRLDENDDGYNMAQLRKYEVNKMRYYYAVVFCDARKTAKRILDEYSGFEVELTNIRLNLSIVPDELDFPQDLKEEASEIPADYNFDGGKISRALNHSTVKLTWDQTDPKRMQKLQQNAKMLSGKRKKPVDTDDEDAAYRDLIASDSGENEYDSEVQSNAEDRAKEQAHIDKMRQLLLGSISQDPTSDDRQKRKDIQADSDEELDVKFGVGFGGDIGRELLDKK